MSMASSPALPAEEARQPDRSAEEPLTRGDLARAGRWPPPELPTFPFEVGYRRVQETATGEWRQLPLTLLEILYPVDDDVGEVKMTQSPVHDLWTSLLAVMLRSYLSVQEWLVLHDVIVHWGWPGVPSHSPDMAAIPGGTLPVEEDLSYRVGRDGPAPVFVGEVTSVSSRTDDLGRKRLEYAAMGVREYLIIDILTPATEPWRLLGFRLGQQPFYDELVPDAASGLTFETVGLRFMAVGRERVEVYDAETGERLLSLDEARERLEEEQARLEQEIAAHTAAEERASAAEERATAAEERATAAKERAETEAAARAAAEARVAELLARLQKLEPGADREA